jgi:hypothetical protein
MVGFPSDEFFRELQRLMRERRERFRALGFFDVTFGVSVLPDLPGSRAHRFVLRFEVFDCVEVAAVDRFEDQAIDFVLEGRLGAWREMLENIRARGAADAAHSVNTLTHFGEQLRVHYDDPDGHDKLYRFAESVQEFFDLAAHLDIAFAGPERPAAAPA